MISTRGDSPALRVAPSCHVAPICHTRGLYRRVHPPPNLSDLGLSLEGGVHPTVRSGQVLPPVSSGPSMGTRALAKLDVRTIGPHCYTIQS